MWNKIAQQVHGIREDMEIILTIYKAIMATEQEEKEAAPPLKGVEETDTSQKVAEAEKKPKPVKEKGRKRIRIDRGKLLALHNAGWPNKDIAVEFGCSTQTIQRIISEMKEEGTC